MPQLETHMNHKKLSWWCILNIHASRNWINIYETLIPHNVQKLKKNVHPFWWHPNTCYQILAKKKQADLLKRLRTLIVYSYMLSSGMKKTRWYTTLIVNNTTSPLVEGILSNSDVLDSSPVSLLTLRTSSSMRKPLSLSVKSNSRHQGLREGQE